MNTFEEMKSVMDKWTPEYVEYIKQKYWEQSEEESVWLSCLEQGINIFLNDDSCKETNIEFDTLNNFIKAFQKFGFNYNKEEYDDQGYELNFDTTFENEFEQKIELRGSWFYGNFKLTKLWMR